MTDEEFLKEERRDDFIGILIMLLFILIYVGISR